ncbi:MAG: AsmA-like C-terminal region-containing protein [Halioglobus sp.]
MNWLRRLGGALLAILLLLTVAVGGFLTTLHISPSSLVPAISYTATRLLGREVRLSELDEVSLGSETTLKLRGLTLDNPDWASSEPMLELGYLRLVLVLPSLWREGSILIRDVQIGDLTLVLLSPEGQTPNWIMEDLASGDPSDENEEDALFPIIVEKAELSNLKVTYIDPDQDVTAQVDSFTLTRDPATGMTQTFISGQVNEFPLSGGGELGPTAAMLSGKNLELDLDLQLGDLQVSAKGSVADALTAQGADLVLHANAPRSRPILDMLGLEEVRDGPLTFDGRLVDEMPGLRLEAEGKLADFNLSVQGLIEQPTTLDGVDLKFYVDGPSMTEMGAILGISGFRNHPFDLSGHVSRRGTVLRVENGRLQAGQGNLVINGVLPNFPNIDDWQVDLQGTGLNISNLAPFAGAQELPDLLCDINGQFTSDDDGVELIDLVIDEGDLRLEVSGVLGDLPGLANTSLDARLSGSDLTRLRSVIGLETLPPTPFELSGTLARIADGWRVAAARLKTNGVLVNASAELDHLVGFQRMALRGTISSPDLPATLELYGIGSNAKAPVPLQLELEAELVGGGYEISSLSGSLGAITLTGQGLLSSQAGLVGSRLKLQGEGDNLGKALAAFTDTILPELPFELLLDAIYHSPLIEIETLDAKVGSNILTGALKLEGTGQDQVARGHLSLHGDSIQNLVELAGLDLKVTDGNYKATTEVELRPDSLALKKLRVDSVKSDIGGDVALRFGDIPHISVNLHSDNLYLPLLWPHLATVDSPQLADDAGIDDDLEEKPTRKEMRERVIPDTPLPLGWLTMLEGQLNYSVDESSVREGLEEGRMKVQLMLKDGVLNTEQLQWRGPASQGWAKLTLNAQQEEQRISLDVVSNRMPLLWLLIGAEVPKQQATYRASLTAVGETVREAAASLNGSLTVRSSGAQISNNGLDFVFGDMIGSLVDRLNPAVQKEEYTEVECATGGLHAKDGVLELLPGLVVRTDKIDVSSYGKLDLHTEALDINFNTKSRRGIGISASKAITPYLKLAGNLANPWITLNPEAVALSGSVAIATAGASVIAEGLYDRWIATAKNPCRALYGKIKKESRYEALLAFPGPEETLSTF